MERHSGYLVIGSLPDGSSQLVLCAKRKQSGGVEPFAVYTGIPYEIASGIEFENYKDTRISTIPVLVEPTGTSIVVRKLQVEDVSSGISNFDYSKTSPNVLTKINVKAQIGLEVVE